MQNKQYDNNFNNVIMKKINYLAMLLVAGMFAACSDTLEDTTGGNNTNTPATGEGYVKVAINMPTTSGNMTKAVSLDDGTADEYAVNNGILVFFKTTATTGTGTPEATAQFVKAYNVSLNYAGEGGTENNEVTTRHTVIGEAPMAGEDEKIYALAILNKNDLFSVNETTGALQVKQNAASSDVFSDQNETLAALQTALATTPADITKNGFLMLNAPLATTTTVANIADLSKVQTLVPVTVYEDKEKAQAGEAADIYVERVVAKVTLKGFTYDGTDKEYTAEVAKDAADSPFNGDKVKLEGWTLSVTNKTTKAVRDVSALTTWISSDYMSTNQLRFLSTTKIDNKELYRIYWGIDNNYDSDDTYTSAFDVLSTDNEKTWTWEEDTNDTGAPNDASNPMYCLENTMDYGEMDQDKVTTLYIKTTYYADPDNADNAQDFFMYGTREETFLTTAFLNNVKTALGWTDPSAKTIVLAENATGGTYTYVETGESAPVGKKDIKTLFTITDGTETTLSDDDAEKLINALGEIRFYEDGASYYNTVFIRHFDETEYSDVDWDPAKPEYTQKQLGRYGVLRNNWYEITVNSFSGPGKPEIEDPDPDTPVDDAEGYINCQINVLSWAKRSQSVNL